MKRLNSAEVVLIEPNRADAVLFERLLNELGLSPSVRTFGLALNAIAALKSSRPPDLIVMESVLPMLELPEVIDELRSLRGCEQVPIVAFKGLGMPRRLQHPGIAFSNRDVSWPHARSPNASPPTPPISPSTS